jgi:succinate dehydrogenase flavin-adding protein (antitoxin of CptAB toxin-antitoxin module)
MLAIYSSDYNFISKKYDNLKNNFLALYSEILEVEDLSISLGINHANFITNELKCTLGKVKNLKEKVRILLRSKSLSNEKDNYIEILNKLKNLEAEIYYLLNPK